MSYRRITRYTARRNGSMYWRWTDSSGTICVHARARELGRPAEAARRAGFVLLLLSLLSVVRPAPGSFTAPTGVA
jgi:hypothetical protein